MRILVLHRIPYHKICYHRGIDHQRHDVVYVGTQAALQTIPPDLRCTRVVRPGAGKVTDEVLALFQQGSGFDRVISLSEYEILEAARVREALGVPGPTVAETLLVRDKILMKEAVAAAGLSVPGHARVTELADGLAGAPDAGALASRLPWTGKTILKPVDGASSENVRSFASAQEALDAIGAALRGQGSGSFDPARYELEEFVEGDIVHFDGVIVDGHPLAIVGSKYVNTCLAYANGTPLGSVQLDASDEDIAWALACIRAVKIENSSFHLEGIRAPRGLVFLEIAARVGGADVVDSFELATDVYLPAVELAGMVGEAGDLPAPKQGKKYGWFVWPGHHLGGDTCEIRGLDRFRDHPNIVRLNHLAPDAPLPKNITYQAVEVPLAGIAVGDTTAEVEAVIRDIFTSVSVLPRAGHPAPDADDAREAQA